MLTAARTLFVLILLAVGLAPPALAQSAGSLVSATPVVETPAGMQAWKIVYRSADAKGKLQDLTGMVIAPREAIPTKPRKVLAWTHGTWGVVEKCAPSLSANFYAATPGLAEAIRRGYVVVAPDYAGLGSAMPHPFLVGIDTARAVLDAVRAAGGIPGAAAGTRFAVWGESQGGHAAMWTAIEAARYAPELTLVGTAAAAPPTDLAANMRQGSDPNARALLTAFATYAWAQFYGAPLGTIYNRTNVGVVERLSRNNCVELNAKPKLGTILGLLAVKGALKSKDVPAIRPWSDYARLNSLRPAAVPGPLLIAQGSKDTIVAPAVTLAFARARCRLGKPLTYIAMPGVEHAASARDSTTATLDWIDARFAGAREPNDCRRI